MSNLNTDVNQFKRLSGSSKLVIFAIFMILFGASYFFGRYFLTRNTAPATTTTEQGSEAQNPAGTAVLAVEPTTNTLAVGETVDIAVALSKDAAQAIDVVLTFDPQYIQISNVRAGKNFPVLISQSVEEGRVVVSASITPEKATEPQVGEVAIMTVTAIAPVENTFLQFDGADTIAAKDGANILNSSLGASFTVTQ